MGHSQVPLYIQVCNLFRKRTAYLIISTEFLEFFQLQTYLMCIQNVFADFSTHLNISEMFLKQSTATSSRNVASILVFVVSNLLIHANCTQYA